MTSRQTQIGYRIHPLVAAAAASVTVLALVGTAAIAGWLPTSHGAANPQDAAPSKAMANTPELAEAAPYDPAPAGQALAPGQPQTARTQPVHHAVQVAQGTPSYREAAHPESQQRAPLQPVQQQRVQQAAQPNYLGIGAGAVIGGLLGNQVGNGRGRTLATIAGAVGGGLVGNEVQKQSQPSN